MKREDISKIFTGATEEQISALLDINSADIGKMKQERDSYKAQYDAVQEKLKGFDGVNVTELQGKIKSLSAELETANVNHAKELEGIRFNATLEDRVKSFNPKNSKLVMALLDVDKLRESKNQDADIAAALETVKKENDYLFTPEKTAPRVVAGTSTTQTNNADKKAQANEAFRALLGKEN